MQFYYHFTPMQSLHLNTHTHTHPPTHMCLTAVQNQQTLVNPIQVISNLAGTLFKGKFNNQLAYLMPTLAILIDLPCILLVQS